MSNRRVLLRLATTLILCLAAGPLLADEETVRTQLPGASTGTLDCQYMEFRSTENVLYARGQVVMVSSGTHLEADEAILHLDDRRALATGHVYIEDGEMTLVSEKADYNWGLSTGVVYNGYILDPPWRLWGREIVRLGPDRYTVRRAAMTNCDLDPPHYHFRGRRGRYVPHKRATVYGGALSLEKNPLLYTPFYTRSLRDKRWTLRVEPGQNSREGLFAKSIFGYKLTDNTYTRLYWDHFEKTGNGVGAEYNYYLPDVKGSVYSYRIEDRVAQTERWNFRAGHWQQLKPRWALQANAVFQSDQDFNNLYFRDDYERVRQRADSDAALTYQNPLYSARVSFEQDMTFNTTHQAFVRDHTVLPQLNLQSSPLNLGKREVYLTLTGNFINTYQRPEVTDLLTQKPTFYHERDLFKQSADGTLDLSKKIQLGKNTTLKPAVGVIEEWQAWRESGVSEIDRKDLYQGRVYTKTNLRRRLTRDLDGDLTHTYRVRWSPNQMKRDHSSSLLDSGTEANSLDLFLSYRMGRLLWVRASSGYDLRVLQGETIETVRQKISPPNVEVNITPTQTLSFFYRQSVLLYPARKTQTSQFSVQVGEIEKPHLESGLSYNVGTPHQLQVRHGAAFPLTKG